MKKTIVAVSLLLILGLGVGVWLYRFDLLPNYFPAAPSGYAGLGSKGPGSGQWPGMGPSRVQPVSAGVVKQQDIRVSVSALGTMTALNTATVRAKVDAELKAIHFREGEIVKAGQVLVDLDTQSLEIQLTLAQGQFDRDNAQYKNALIDLQRYKELLSKDAIAVQQVDTQEALTRQLKGSVLADQGALDNARLQVSFAHVVAPIAGRLGLKQVELGSLVRSSDPNGIVSITQFQPISAVFAVPEKYVPNIQIKLRKNEPLPVQVWDAQMQRILGSGKVSFADNAIDPSTGTLKLKALLDNKDELLFPNQFVNIKLQLDVLKNVLTVPSSAVQRGAVGTFVYVINEDSTVITRGVKLLALDGDLQGVEGDLKGGDRVVIDGADRLRDKSKVEVVRTSQANGASGETNGANVAAPSKPSTQTDAGGMDPKTQTGSKAQPGSKVDAGLSAEINSKPQASPRAETGRERPKWMDRLPPEILDKVKTMSEEERQVFFQKMRERRRQTQGE